MRKIDLTTQEIQVIKLICKQYTSKEIGLKMGYSFRTIEDIRLTIQKKVGAKNTVGIVVYAIKHGIYSIRKS